MLLLSHGGDVSPRFLFFSVSAAGSGVFIVGLLLSATSHCLSGV